MSRANGLTISALAVVLLVAGCGSRSTHKSAAGAARRGLTQRLPAIGRPVMLNARCHRVGCSLTYDYTPPDGYRRQYLATVPASCAHTCSVRWAGFKVRRIVRKFGLDPDYPVGECAHALDVYIGRSFTDTPAQRARALRTESLACAGVHKGVYTGPLLTAPGG